MVREWAKVNATASNTRNKLARCMRRERKILTDLRVDTLNAICWHACYRVHAYVASNSSSSNSSGSIQYSCLPIPGPRNVVIIKRTNPALLSKLCLVKRARPLEFLFFSHAIDLRHEFDTACEQRKREDRGELIIRAVYIFIFLFLSHRREPGQTRGLLREQPRELGPSSSCAFPSYPPSLVDSIYLTASLTLSGLRGRKRETEKDPRDHKRRA